MGKNAVVQKVFHGLKKVYLKLPVDKEAKIKAKNAFYKVFGPLFKNTPSYQQWAYIHAKSMKKGKVKISDAQLKKFTFSGKIAIQLHLFYVDLMDEFVKYFNHMPYPFDLYISVMDQSLEDEVRRKAEKIRNVSKITIKQVENRGRDVSPFISVFGQEMLQYDYCCHVHSKKSLFTGNEQMDWRKHLLNHLFGSETLIKSIFYWFEKGEKIGMIYPETYPGMPYWGHTWLQNTVARNTLLQRIGVGYIPDRKYIEYPMGTMFWARTEALHQFFDAGIKVSEFPEEKGQTDGTIAHAFERCLVPVCRYNGFNTLIFDETTGEFTYNHGKKNFNQYDAKSFEDMKLQAEQYDIISFDIFDTLVERSIARPDDLFDFMEMELEEKYSGIPFKQLRKEAEMNCRVKRPSEDPDLDDIYRELEQMSKYSADDCKVMMETELNTEMKFLSPRKEVVELYRYLKEKKHKKCIIVTDMYMRRQDIEKILQMCGITCEEIWLSSETNLRKDNGSVWKALKEKYGESLMHIGDNEVSDIQLCGDYRLHNYHIMSGKDLFECSGIGEFYSFNSIRGPLDSIASGLVVKKLFTNPFRMNPTGFELKITDEKEFGYSIFGPVITGYMNHLCREALKAGTEQILFFAREGYVLQNIYKVMQEKVLALQKIRGDYLLTSRRSLSVASIETQEDITGLLDIYYRGSFGNLLHSRFGITDPQAEELEVELPEQKSIIQKKIGKYYPEIFAEAEKERKAYLRYYNGIAGHNTGKLMVSDIGYSGSIQYYLSKLTKDTYPGIYFATDAKKRPLKIAGNTIEGYYIDADTRQEYSDSWIHRYHLLLESVLIAPAGQFVHMDENQKPVYTEEVNQQYTPQIQKIQEGIRQYVEDFYGLCGEKALQAELEKTFMEELIHAAVKCGIADKKLEDCFVVEDTYCSDSRLNAMEHYREIEESREEQ